MRCFFFKKHWSVGISIWRAYKASHTIQSRIKEEFERINTGEGAFECRQLLRLTLIARHKKQFKHLYKSGIYAIAERVATAFGQMIAIFKPRLVYCRDMIDHRQSAGILRGGTHSYEDIISVENLLAAWREFIAGKRKKADVQEFQHRLMDNVLALRSDLKEGSYRHGEYYAFKISDPKPRDIHKATVRDRLLHHAIYRVLYPVFDRTWITDSYSCRDDKGTHRARDRFRRFTWTVSKNHTRTCWVLKCDIRKFFASIHHETLLGIVAMQVPDRRTVELIGRIVESFHSTPGVGLPLGNLTSQLLVNVYMNEFDQHVKHGLNVRHYIRYADDFVVLSESRSYLEKLLPLMQLFLRERLHLAMHPNKVHIRTISSGVDFLGWIHFTDHRILRTSTKRRLIKNVPEGTEAQRASYKALIAHGNTQKIAKSVF